MVFSWTCYKFDAVFGGKIILKNPLQDLLSSLNAVISTNESTPTGHVIYNPAYTYKFQLKTTIVVNEYLGRTKMLYPLPLFLETLTYFMFTAAVNKKCVNLFKKRKAV